MNNTKILQVQNMDAEQLEKRFNEIQNTLNKLMSVKEEQPKTDLLTRKEAAEILKISLVTLYTWTKHNILSAHKIANKVYYKRAEIEKALVQISGE